MIFKAYTIGGLKKPKPQDQVNTTRITSVNSAICHFVFFCAEYAAINDFLNFRKLSLIQ